MNRYEETRVLVKYCHQQKIVMVSTVFYLYLMHVDFHQIKTNQN